MSPIIVVVAQLHPPTLECLIPVAIEATTLPGDTWMIAPSVGILDECRFRTETREGGSDLDSPDSLDDLCSIIVLLTRIAQLAEVWLCRR